MTNDKTLNRADAAAGAARKERESLIGRIVDSFQRNQNKRNYQSKNRFLFVSVNLLWNNRREHGQWTNYYESVKFYLLFIVYYEYKLPKFIIFISLVYCLVTVPMFRIPFRTPNTLLSIWYHPSQNNLIITNG